MAGLFKSADKAASTKSDINSALALVNYAELNDILTSKIKLNKPTAYLIAAYLLKSGLIRFIINKGKRDATAVDIGVNRDRIDMLSSGGGIQVKDGGRRRSFLTHARMHNDELLTLLRSLKHYTDKSDKGTVAKLNRPNTFGLEEVSQIKFRNRSEEIIFWISRLLERLNEGHFGTSIMIEAIQKHLEERRFLSLSDIERFMKKLENLVSPEKQADMVRAKEVQDILVEIPDLNPHKRPWNYQWKGVNWCLAAERGILAFDTGLGKTMVAIAFTYVAKKLGMIKGSIVFTKKSIITDFIKEIKDVWPNAKVVLLYGNQRDRLGKIDDANDADFVICSYGSLSREMPEMMDFFMDNKNMAMFFDEGSRIRNTGTNTRDTVKKIIEDRKYIFILDATPFPNDVLMDAWNLINLVREGQLGTSKAWVRRFAIRGAATTKGGKTIEAYTNLGEMRDTIGPFMFVKNEDDPDVDIALPPERREIDKTFTMGPRQCEWYRKAQERTLRDLIDMLNPANEKYQDPINVLASLTRQRQVAVSPRLIEESYNDDDERIELAVDLAQEWLTSKPDSSIIIGAEYRSIFPHLRKLLCEKLDLTDDQVVEFSGKTTLEQGEKIKEGINNGTIKIGLLGYKSAGAGINLQHNAHRIILLHKPWNPNVVTQFIDRVDRQGQKRRVTVVSLIAEDSIDIKIEDLLVRKSHEQSQMLTSERAEKAGKLTLRELAGLAGIDMSKIKELAQEKGITVEEETEVPNLGEVD